MSWWTRVCLLTAAGGALFLLSRDRPSGSVYAGLTTSEWERELAYWDVEQPSCGTGNPPLSIAPRRNANGVFPRNSRTTLPLVSGDAAALPVLMELFASADPKARRVAIEGVRRIGEPARAATPLLRAALQDPDVEVFVEAAITLSKFEKGFAIDWAARRAQIHP